MGSVFKKKNGKSNNDKNNKESKAKEKKPKISFLKLFRFADWLDILLMILGAICGIALGAVLPAFALLFGQLVDAFNLSPDQLLNQVSMYALDFVYAGIGSFFAAYGMTAFWITAAERQLRRIRTQYLKAILRQEIAWFDSIGTGELTSRISSDTLLIQDAIGDQVGNALRYSSTAVAGYVVGLIKGWQLALVILAVSPLLIVSGAFMMKMITSLSTAGQKAYGYAGNIATEVISSIRTVASFSGEKREYHRYSKRLFEARDIGIHRSLVTGVGFGLTMFFLFGSYSLALWYGGTLIISHGYTGGTILTVLFSVIFASFAMGQASPSFEAISKGQGAAYKIYNTIDRVSSIDPFSHEGKIPKEVKGDVVLKDICFKYPTRPDVGILKDLSISISSGETVALVGASGCGKSSIISLLQRFYIPQKGQILLDGNDISDLNVQWLRKQFGLVSQEPILFSGTIEENIAYGGENPTLEEIEAAARAANAHNFIVEFPEGYSTQVGEKGAQLSGGQKQRIAIARAIVRNPKILLLDEATSALDNESERVVQAALDSVMKGRTTLVIAHRLSTIRDANRILVIQDGNVVEQGTYQELLSKEGIFYALNRAQVEGQESQLSNRATKSGSAVSKKHSKSISTSDKSKTNQQSTSNEDIYDVSFFRLAKLNKPELGFIIVGCFAAAIHGTVNPAYAIIFSHILNVFFFPTNQIASGLVPWVLGIFGIGVIVMLSNIAQTLMFGIAGEYLTQRLRQLTFMSILKQSVGWFDHQSHSTGILASQLASDANLVQGAIGTRLSVAVQNIATIVSGLIIGFYFGWKLCLVILATAPLLVLSNISQMRAMKGLTEKNRKALADANQIATETIVNIRTVAAFGSQKRIISAFEKKIWNPSVIGIKTGHTNGLFVGFGQFAMFGSNALGFWYGGVLIHDGELNFLDVMTVFMAIFMSAMSIGQAMSLSSDATKAKSATSAIFKLVDSESEIDSYSTEGIKLDNIRGQIEFQNVEFHYPTRPDTPIFKDLNLKVDAGKVLALVGSSGGGKSTVVALLERFYNPISGKIFIDGIDVRTVNLQSLRQQIGLVSQEPVLFSGTIGENIAYGKPDATQTEIEAAAKAANAHEFITEFPEKYNTQVGERGTQLSGGQKQRIAIARAIIKNPGILLFDEATSALDSESEEVVQKALDSVMSGRTTIVIAHRLSTIRNADCIAVINSGKIEEMGTHEELIKKDGLYAALASAQS